MNGGLQNWFTFTMPAGGGQVNQDLRVLNSTAHNMPLHFDRIDLKLHLNLTGDTADDEPGENFPLVIQRIELRDILNNLVVNLRGRHCDQFCKFVRGHRYATPADGGANDDAADHYWYASIPFHGGPGGIAGMHDYWDAVQPIERFREQVMTVYFDAAALTYSTLNSAVLYVSFHSLPYKEINQGADIRYNYFEHPDQQRIELSVTGKAVSHAAICNSDLDHSDYGPMTSEQFAYASNVQRQSLIGWWNMACAHSADQFENQETPEFFPVLFGDRRATVQGMISYPGQKAIYDITNTHGATMDLVSLQVHNTKRLCDRLMNKRGTLFEQMTHRKPKLYKKNEAGVATGDPQLADRLGTLLAQKLVRG